MGSLKTTASRFRKSWNPWLAILLAALIACLPRLVRGVSCGHDFDFHLISWMETERSWSLGIPYPHWAQSPDWGAGEPRFVFYPPLSWIFGALLGYLVHWRWASAAYTFLCFAGAGFTTRILARRFLPEPQATLAGVLAAATPYGLFVAYERSAFSELAAAVWIPLLLLYALDLPQRNAGSLNASGRIPSASSPSWPPAASTRATTLRSAPLALLLAILWLTNAPAGVMATYLLAFAALAAAWLQRSWTPILRALIATPIGLGLAAIYLVPAAWEQRWIAINQALDVGMRVKDSWLFARHHNPSLELHDEVLLYASTLFAVTAAAALIGLAICLRRKSLPQQSRSWWLPLALLIPILLFLQFPISTPIWNLPKLEFLQFPWRWLMVLATPYAIFCAAATPLHSRRARIGSAAFWTGVLLLFSVVASRDFYQYCDEEDRVSNQQDIFADGTGMAGTDEYAPTAADNSLVASGLPDGCLVADPTQQLGETDTDASPEWYPEQGSCDDTYTASLWQPEHKHLQINSDHDGYLVLRMRRYPAWQITINGKPAANPPGNPIPLRDDGLVVLPIHEGLSTIDVRWTTTPDELWGRSISLVSLAVLLLLWIAPSILLRRSTIPLNPPRLS